MVKKKGDDDQQDSSSSTRKNEDVDQTKILFDFKIKIGGGSIKNSQYKFRGQNDGHQLRVEPAHFK